MGWLCYGAPFVVILLLYGVLLKITLDELESKLNDGKTESKDGPRGGLFRVFWE